MRKAEITMIVLVVLALVAAAVLYPFMPAEVASHWNVQGQVDGTLPRFWGTFIMPLAMLLTTVLLIAVPRIDPLKKNIAGFIKYYDGFIILINVFLLVMFAQMMLWNVGIQIDIGTITFAGVALLLYYSGILMEHAKRNWFIGIRTPWTLSSDVVWDKTHKVGAWWMKILAVIVLAGIFFPNYAVYLIMVSVLSYTVFVFVYSYVQYQREQAKS